MNILYVHRTQGVGVEATHIYELCNAFMLLGHNVDIFSPYGLIHSRPVRFRNGPLNFSKLSQAVSQKVPEFLFEILEILYNFVIYPKLSKILREKGYDLIYERYAFNNFMPSLLARYFQIPHIFEINYTTDVPMVRKRSIIFSRLTRFIESKCLEWSTGYASISTPITEILVKKGIQASDIVLTPNAADPVKFDYTRTGQRFRKELGITNKKVIGFVGGFYYWHGLGFLIDAFAALRKKILNTHLVLIGDGPEKGALIKKIRDLDLSQDVSFIGRVDHALLPEYVAMFDVGVVPDSNEYGSPMKIFEYMAMGKPVVAPSYKPLTDVISDGIEGLLFRPKSKEGFCDALERVLASDSFRKTLGRNARRKIETERNWLVNAKRVLSILCS